MKEYQLRGVGEDNEAVKEERRDIEKRIVKN